MYMLHNGPYRARSHQPAWFRHFLVGYTVVLKIVLILCVTTVFFQVTTFLLAFSTNDWVQLLVLALWACGLIPLVYGLWQLELKPPLTLPMPRLGAVTEPTTKRG
ncbi:MAG: hypothetical protein KF832_31330 [Caldilineaceae bacterium]|nr:hypothetical protein [Caldilineaceae bacterium]